MDFQFDQTKYQWKHLWNNIFLTKPKEFMRKTDENHSFYLEFEPVTQP